MASSAASGPFRSVTPYRRVPVWQRKDTALLAVTYATIVGGCVHTGQDSIYVWAGAVFGGALFHVLTMLVQLWFIDLHCVLSLTGATLADADLVKVVPHQHGGSATPRPLTCADDGGAPSFAFQNAKYEHFPARGGWELLQFLDTMSFGAYQQSAGHTSAAGLEEATARWGTNALEIPLPEFSALMKEHTVKPPFVFQIAHPARHAEIGITNANC